MNNSGGINDQFVDALITTQLVGGNVDMLSELNNSITLDEAETEDLNSLTHINLKDVLRITANLRNIAENSESESECEEDIEKDPDYVPESECLTVGQSFTVTTHQQLPKVLDVEHTDRPLPKTVEGITAITDSGIVAVHENNNESMPRLSHRKLNEDCIIRDTECTNIYVKVYQKAECTRSGVTKATTRPYDTVHACKYCGQLMTNIQVHLEKKHNDEKQVEEMLLLKSKIAKEKDKEECTKFRVTHKNIQDIIRCEGDHLHNMLVIKANEGELLVARRGKEAFQHTDYGPCPGCLIWLRLNKCMVKHQSVCVAGRVYPELTSVKSSLLFNSGVISGKIAHGGSKRMKTEVFPSMRMDKLTAIAQKDFLIVALGEEWVTKSFDNKLRRNQYASFHMRQMARNLMNMRKLAASRDKPELENAPLLTFICPANFELVVEATLMSACGDEEASIDLDRLQHPSTVIKLGFDLARVASCKLCLGIEKRQPEIRTDAADFLQLMKLKWSLKATKFARISLLQNQKRKLLPSPTDLRKLSEYLSENLRNTKLVNDIQTFRSVATLVQARLMTYNKRRSGELEMMSLDQYNAGSTGLDTVEEGLTQALSPLEQYLCRTQELIDLRNKRGLRSVPLLIPEDCLQPLAYLTNKDVRKDVKIRPLNTYVFANSSLGVIRAYDSLKKMSYQAPGLQFPERIYGTSCRMLFCTVIQSLNIPESTMQQVFAHMGHDPKVHRLYYRQTSGMLERMQVGKLMMIHERNLYAKFQNKDLHHITFDDIVEDDEVRDGLEADESNDEPHSIADISSTQQPECQVTAEDDLVETDVLSWPDDPQNDARKEPRDCSTRAPWTQEETAEIYHYFGKSISAFKNVNEAEVRRAIAQSKANKKVLHLRKRGNHKKEGQLYYCNE